jgi:hypothetical protein
MRVVFWLWIAVFLLTVFAAGFVVFAARGASGGNLQRVQSSTEATGKLPSGTFVVTFAEGAKLAEPFVLRQDSQAVGGLALSVPEGSQSKDLHGRAEVTVTPPMAGAYQVWARALWRDSCGNSVAFSAGSGPETVLGNDSVYNNWHWVSGGTVSLGAGETRVSLKEREDGVELDQILFTPDAAFVPTGPVIAAGELRGIRQFGDDFTRSPGHGMEAWDLVSGKWDISFSFDPNRIPNQYALQGTATAENGTAVALIKGAPWYGCRVCFSVYPQTAARFGVVLDQTESDARSADAHSSSDTKSAAGAAGAMALFDVSEKSARAECGSSSTQQADCGKALRLQQWHRVEVERWGWTLRIKIDGRDVCVRHDLLPRAGAAGFFVERGQVYFDDVRVEEIPWFADDGATQSAPWTVSAGAQWFRGNDGPGPAVLSGTGGALELGSTSLFVAEALLEEETGAEKRSRIDAEGLAENATVENGMRVFSVANGAQTGGHRVALSPRENAEARVRRVAVRFAQPVADTFALGPFHFTEAAIEDPSDYLDFTPEEYRAMEKSPDREKLRREAKYKPIVGDRRDDESPWVHEGGAWRIANGILMGMGANATLRCAQELAGPYELRLRFRLQDDRACFEIDTCAGPDPALRTRVGGTKPERVSPPVAGFLYAAMKPDREWHSLLLKTHAAGLTLKIDDNAEQNLEAPRGDGGRIYLRVADGRVDFDDLEVRMERYRTDGDISAFRNRETNWWREGGNWIDHGGIACVLASSWVSLVAPEGAGMLWHKAVFNDDVLVAFDVEENSEWRGWDKYPSHVHYPYDNICVELNAGGESGYRLAVNADRRRASILYRDGKEVARVAQDGNFPMHFVNGHMPYFPRRNRIELVKRGGLVRAIVNGREILKFDDPQPLAVRRVGVGGFQTHINFSNIEVLRLK